MSVAWNLDTAPAFNFFRFSETETAIIYARKFPNGRFASETETAVRRF
jgi:hypothetical protein